MRAEKEKSKGGLESDVEGAVAALLELKARLPAGHEMLGGGKKKKKKDKAAK